MRTKQAPASGKFRSIAQLHAGQVTNNREIRKVAEKQLDEVEAAIQQSEILPAFFRAEEKQAEVLAGQAILSSHPGFRAQISLPSFRFRVMLAQFQATR